VGYLKPFLHGVVGVMVVIAVASRVEAIGKVFK
jgi:hypothetical protein